MYFFLSAIACVAQTLWEFPAQNKILKTDVVAFTIQGKSKLDRLYVADFDILIISDSKRLIPLLRTLRLLGVNGQLKDNVITFKFTAIPEVKIDLIQKTLTSEHKKMPLEIKIGNSDVTNMGEIFVDEFILKDGFGLPYQWSEANYEYKINTEENLEIFKLNRYNSTSLLSTKVEHLANILSETEPPVYPEHSRQLISFVQTELRADSRWQNGPVDQNFSTLLRPGLTFWGYLLKGNYRLRLNQNIYFPHASIPALYNWIDEGLWTSKHENFVTQVGDTNIGFSDLVAPGVNLFGVTVKWLSSTKENIVVKEKLFMGQPEPFGAAGIIDGTALLGASVELWVNNRFIQSKIVQDVFVGKPGFGYYRFDSIGLLDKSLNEVKMVIKRQDGVTEEIYRYVLGTAQLLPAGQVGILTGVGTHRQKNINSVTTKGLFSGGQINYGFSDDITLGVTAAAQDKFAFFKDDFGNYYPASKSYGVGQQMNIRFFDRWLAREEFAISHSTDVTRDLATAYKLGLEYYLKKAKMESDFFSYGAGFSNTVTNVSDRRGYTFTGNVALGKNLLATGIFLHIRDNLAHDLPVTNRENLFSGILSLPGIFPKSVGKARMDYADRSGEISKKYITELETQLTKKLSIEARYTFGDKTDLSPTRYLTYGLPLPQVVYSFSYGTRLKAAYRLDDINSLYAMFWHSEFQKQMELSYFHRHYDRQGKHIWNSRLDLGRVLSSSKYYGKGYWEFDLDEVGYNKYGLNAGFDQNGKSYYLGLYLSLTNLFSLGEGKLKYVSRRGISPELGGISGSVYLDANGNGHRDPGESGLANIGVLVDGRSATESDKNGDFYLPLNTRKDCMVLTLDLDSLAAIYIPTQGMQKVYCKEGIFTRANLGVCVVSAISGRVKSGRLNGTFQDFPGARIILMSEDQKSIVKDSITAADGSFYIGEIKPGIYVLDVDKESVPDVYKIKEMPRKITVCPDKEPQEIDNCNFDLVIMK